MKIATTQAIALLKQLVKGLTAMASKDITTEPTLQLYDILARTLKVL